MDIAHDNRNTRKLRLTVRHTQVHVPFIRELLITRISVVMGQITTKKFDIAIVHIVCIRKLVSVDRLQLQISLGLVYTKKNFESIFKWVPIGIN